jgi:hypothetical protein
MASRNSEATTMQDRQILEILGRIEDYEQLLRRAKASPEDPQCRFAGRWAEQEIVRLRDVLRLAKLGESVRQPESQAAQDPGSLQVA